MAADPRVVGRRGESAVAWPGPFEVETEGGGQREHAHRVRRRGAVDDDVVPLAPTRPARRPRAGRAPPEFPAVPKAPPGQRFPDRTRETGRRAGRRPRATAPPAARACPAPARRGSRRPASASRSASTRVGSRTPVGMTVAPSTSPIECAWSVETMSTRSPARASRTAVAVASVDLPTPPLPTKRLIRAGTAVSARCLTQPRLVS